METDAEWEGMRCPFFNPPLPSHSHVSCPDFIHSAAFHESSLIRGEAVRSLYALPLPGGEPVTGFNVLSS